MGGISLGLVVGGLGREEDRRGRGVEVGTGDVLRTTEWQVEGGHRARACRNSGVAR